MKPKFRPDEELSLVALSPIHIGASFSCHLITHLRWPYHLNPGLVKSFLRFEDQTIMGDGDEKSDGNMKWTHGVLNAVSWGVLMPIGAMAARYLKVANPAWFYVHAATQTSAYIVGVAGWATGLKLGSDSTGIKYNTHRNIGIILFAFGTLQVFSLLLRPKPDNKYRFYWNIYHRSLGYSVIILSIINVCKGLDIMDPEMKWKNAYTGIVISLLQLFWKL
ncbi:hypothetical protein L1987_40025 [Smallanthus sonchifolius]|uniref:Uncharacterized protein n=1 Tax=Smallanthus sonchifolius TaxID=185202 RepID=A0ACB9GTN1_9ASTR|nr:hypothetical protein L1987_40025 [Smallanthus sonchifolius]